MVKRKAQIPRIKSQCEWCHDGRTCRLRAEFERRFLATMFDPVPAYCQEHQPIWFRGMEGVAA
jgi:hypothetical protein